MSPRNGQVITVNEPRSSRLCTKSDASAVVLSPVSLWVNLRRMGSVNLRSLSGWMEITVPVDLNQRVDQGVANKNGLPSLKRNMQMGLMSTSTLPPSLSSCMSLRTVLLVLSP